MNNSVKIDSKLLLVKIEALKKENEKMKILFENVKNKANQIPNLWISDTSDVVMNDFQKLYAYFEEIIDGNNKYISYLENVVAKDYNSIESDTANLIESNL